MVKKARIVIDTSRPKRKRQAFQIAGPVGGRTSTKLRMPRLSLAPRRLITKMRYILNEDGTPMRLTSTGSTVENVPISCNNVYNPRNLGGPVWHQPLGFDQYNKFYGKGCVLSAQIHLNYCLDENQPPNHPTLVYLRLHQSAGPPLKTTLLEEPRRTWKILNVHKPQASITGSFNPQRFFQKNKIMDYEQVHFTGGSPPAEEAYWHVGCFVSGATEGLNTAVMVQGYIEYTVLWYDLRTPKESTNPDVS